MSGTFDPACARAVIARSLEMVEALFDASPRSASLGEA
jgi:hypothetical protein